MSHKINPKTNERNRANRVKPEPILPEITGDIVKMRDGTRYAIQKNGSWKRLPKLGVGK